nr:rhodanese-like domain-containing protein [Nocardioides convexus]
MRPPSTSFAAALDQGAPVIDVREPAEFREGHVPGATNIPMGQPDRPHGRD